MTSNAHSSMTLDSSDSLPKQESAVKEWLLWMVTTPRVLVSGGFLVLLCVVAIAAPLIADTDHAAMRAGEQFKSPNLQEPLGTDEFGRNILSRLVFGSRTTLIVSITSVAIATTVGLALGMLAAYFRGIVDTILMRLADAILAFPPILLAVFVIVFLSPSLINVILVIGILYIPRFQRIAYSSTLSVQENEYIEAYRAIGARTGRILVKGILPNILAPIIVQVTLSMGTAILLESGLSFLGLGPPPAVPSWGRMIESASRFMGQSVHPVLWPAIVISLTVLAFNILGDALRDRLDPRLRT